MPPSAHAYARPDLLIDTATLAGCLDAPDLRVFDCTTILKPDAGGALQAISGRADYERGHIPRAGYIDLQQDLSDPVSRWRFTLPDASRFAAVMQRLGVSDDARVVLYSTGSYWWATRVWWMLRVFGFTRAAVLDGGFAKWVAEGRPVASGPAPVAAPAARFSARFHPEMVVDARAVQAAIDDPAQVVVNALSAESFAGRGPSYYGRCGRIRNSVSVPAASLVAPGSQTMLPPDALAAALGPRLTAGATRVITYCGGGIAATGDAFALALLGRDNVAVYDASLQEWGNDPTLPMEAGGAG
ncbi:MAG: sulfurtransferase [Burkholderiales bacterium]|nr:sulfurtransferase [Burkholderiales bacterium]